MTTLHIGLVGTGFLARTRARCYARVHGVDARIHAVASGDADNARRFAAEHDIEHAVASADELFARDDIQLVDLCVPNHLHRPFAIAATRAGKHVVCTKPMAAYVGQDLDDRTAAAQQDRRTMYRVAVDDARAMVNAAAAADVLLMYGENWVYAPPIVRAAGLLAKSPGPLLEMRGWEAHSGSHSPFSKRWEHSGGGALLRLGAHPIGAMLALKRQEGATLVSVTAEVSDLTARTDLDASNTQVVTDWGDVENWGCAILHFSDGARGVAHGSDALLGGMESQLVLATSDAHLKCSLSPHDMLRSYAADASTFGDAYIMEKAGGSTGWNTPLPDEDWSSGHQAMCQAFVEAAAGNERATSDGALGLDVTRAVYAAYISAATGRRIALDDLDARG